MMFVWVGKGEFYSLKSSVHYHVWGHVCCQVFWQLLRLLRLLCCCPGLPLSPCRWRPAILSQVAYIEIVEAKVTQSQIHAWSRLALFTTDNSTVQATSAPKVPRAIDGLARFFWVLHCWLIPLLRYCRSMSRPHVVLTYRGRVSKPSGVPLTYQ